MRTGITPNKDTFHAVFIKKDTLTQVFSSEFCDISKKIFYTEHLRATASETSNKSYLNFQICFCISLANLAHLKTCANIQ